VLDDLSSSPKAKLVLLEQAGADQAWVEELLVRGFGPPKRHDGEVIFLGRGAHTTVMGVVGSAAHEAGS
jgi:hypothetical protein